MFVTRFHSRPFSDGDEEVALVIAGLAAAGLARVLGDERLRELAYTDALTGLANRRAADEQLEAWASDPAYAGALTAMLCDVNDLKEVNDSHGHLVGDRLIREVAGHVSAAADQLHGGIAARVGGDEFLIAGPCPDQTFVTRLVEELTGSASRLSFGHGVSCGTAWLCCVDAAHSGQCGWRGEAHSPSEAACEGALRGSLVSASRRR
ncbi:MAG: GGDEF domain-containing protein [Nocardioidaceae bacterium]|nr:GGDEF domain-containing protein [Nocardioidaceae bacterium]